MKHYDKELWFLTNLLIYKLKYLNHDNSLKSWFIRCIEYLLQ